MTTQPAPLMQFEPPTGLLSLLDAVAAEMADKPDENLEDMENALKQYAEEREERIRAEHETGMLIFETKSGREQLHAFLWDDATGLPVTLPGDMHLILMGVDYYDAAQRGEMPRLECQIRRDFEKVTAQRKNMQAEQDAADMQQMAPKGAQLPEPPVPAEAMRMPYWLWADVYDLGRLDFEIMSAKFRKLVRQYGSKETLVPL